jgi:single-stranded-DNA-specific exonuclease
MGGAEDAVRLLLARDAATAARLMERVEALNLERREIQRSLGEQLPPPGDGAFDLVVEPTAHKGVIGIVAGHRMRAAQRPSAVCTVIDGVAHCSVRAPEAYDLRPLLDSARPYLLTGGGHRYAAGMTFPLRNLSFVKATLNRGAQEQSLDAPSAALVVDGAGTRLAPGASELERLEPFGQGFPEPLLLVEGQVEGTIRTFGAGYRKFKLKGETEDFTLFADEPRSLDGRLCLAVAPQDHARWGRSWRVDGAADPREAR